MAVVLGVGLTGCSPSAPPPPTTPTAVSSPAQPATGTPTLSPTAAPSTATPEPADGVARMSLRRRAGAVLMTAGTVSELPSLRAIVTRYGLAGVMVRGRSAAGVHAVHAAVSAVTAGGSGPPLLVATDQEGGEVQVLRGPGFADIPSAVQQATWAPATLRQRATGWGRSLAAAGVNLNLAPVADTPCEAERNDNPPVADLRRNYGADPKAAGRSVGAVVGGLQAAGVAATLKHFPGLGCVRRNTDTDAHVVDDSIAAGSPRLQPFRDGITAGARFVMVSSATYARIDAARPALFSPTVLTLLRKDLGFRGVVMSDDVGGAAAARAWSPGERATRFVAAGGDLLLDIVPGDIPAMVTALADRAAHDQRFAERLTSAATQVTAARAAIGSS